MPSLHLHRPSSMTSLLSLTSSHSHTGSSPQAVPRDLPSLLIPANPAYLDTSPKGGILINKRRPSDVDPNDFPAAPPPASDTASPAVALGSSPDPSPTQRIRFAPLPDPRRPRSSSTGENLEINSSYDDDGHRTSELSLKESVSQPQYDEEAIDDEDEEDEDENKKGWKAMSMGSWKGTKKLLKPLRSPSVTSALGLERDEDGGLSFGAPLKKSVSTGGVMSSGETERKRSFLSTSPATGSLLSARKPPGSPNAGPTHRRNSSLNETSLGTSPRPVKMLNGRVYGSRRQSDAAPARTAEPEFNEWGGKDGGAMGSRGRSADDDDGSGMEWVKKRREERERRKSEAAQAEPMKIPQPASAASSTASPPMPITPPPPIIQVSEVDSKGGLYPVESRPEEKIRDHEGETHQHEVRQVRLGEAYGDDADDDDEEEEEEEDEQEEDEDEDDDDEEDDFELESDKTGSRPGFRSTSSAAGVEVVSRHK